MWQYVFSWNVETWKRKKVDKWRSEDIEKYIVYTNARSA